MIRPYHPSDKNELLVLLRLNTPAYFAPSEENDFIDYLEKEMEDYFVLEENGKIVGCGGINYWENGTVARISWDIVHPDQQGKGIGKKLTLFRIEEIKKKPTVQSIIVRTSQLAFRFYEKVGFELEKIEKDYWAEGFDLYEMRYKTGN
jgi:ribosomal protein S18 acetylase RimI-like enzyme